MKEISKRGILFISDSSILSPVLHSQGLPLLKSMSRQFNCSLISFENFKQGYDEKTKYESIKGKYISLISFYRVELKKYSIIPFWVNYFFSGFMLSKTIVKKNKIDIVHARSLYPAIISMFLKIIYPRLKLIYDNRGVFIEEQIFLGQWKRQGITETTVRMLEGRVIKKSDHIVVVSEIFKNHLLLAYPSFLGLLRRISVINNKTNINQNITPEELMKRKGVNAITCVYSGSSAKWQNMLEVFSFARNCLSLIENFRFKILTYESRKFSEELMAYRDLYESSEILSVGSDEVFNQLTSANFGLLLRENNIVNNVSSPLKFAEYLAAGMPVVVSEGVGDTEETIKRYKVGVVIKNNDYDSAIFQLKKLLNEPDIYIRCRKVAEKEFNLDNSIEEYKKIYSILSKD